MISHPTIRQRRRVPIYRDEYGWRPYKNLSCRILEMVAWSIITALEAAKPRNYLYKEPL
jgi:hypothetical protein